MVFDRRRKMRVPLGTVKEEEAPICIIPAAALPPPPPPPALVDDILGHWVLASLVFLAVAVLIFLVRLVVPAAVSALVVSCIHAAAVLLEGLIALNGLYLLQGGVLPGGGLSCDGVGRGICDFIKFNRTGFQDRLAM